MPSPFSTTSYMKNLTLLTALLLTSLASLPAAVAASAPRPNIVFIFADDWGWGDLSSHGLRGCRHRTLIASRAWIPITTACSHPRNTSPV